MGISTFPASGGGVKLVQRGQAVSAGSITITAVDMAKTFVRSFSEGASGTVATNSTAAAPSASMGGTSGSTRAQSGTLDLLGTGYNNNSPIGKDTVSSGSLTNAAFWTMSRTVSLPAQSVSLSAPSISIGSQALSGGTMDATTKQMGVYLSNSTTLVATGACRWEVVEFA